MNWLSFISYCGTFVFALTGGLKARTHKMDLFGASVLAFVTAYGGGTIRDLLLGIKPVNWLNDHLALTLVLGALIIIALLKTNIDKFNRTIFVTDAIGLAMFTIAGIQIGLDAGISEIYAIILGVITATFGGLLADILCNNIPDFLHNTEIYATACLIGGFIFVVMIRLGVNSDISIIACVTLIVGLRFLSKYLNIQLPRFS